MQNTALPRDLIPGGLEFFGRVNASISHEIKNSLAVINEVGGLLSDLLGLAAMGKEIPLARYAALAEKITAQVERANQIVKRLNRLAHTVDQEEKSLDLAEEILFVRDLMQRLAGLKSARIETVPPEKPVFVTVNEYGFILTVCLVAEHLLPKVQGGALTLRAECASGCAMLCFEGNYSPETAFAPETARVLAHWIERLGARLDSPGGRAPVELVFATLRK
jgi:hypothetical protein